MRKTLKRVFTGVLSVALAAVLFAGCSNGKTDGKILKVGLDSSFPPMGFVDNKGDLVGFDIDVAKEAVKLMEGYDDVKFIPIDWNAKDTELSSGNIDLIWNGFTMTGLEEKYEWTTAYMNNKQTVVVKEGSAIQTLADLAGKVVVTQEDSSGMKAVEGNEAVMSSLKKLNKVGDYENALMELESGSADALVVDQIVINYKIAQGKKGLAILEETLGDEEYGVAAKKGNTELRDQVQDALNKLAENGKLAEISTKWFSSDITTINK